jgi:DNA-binding NarL/FixJ family response regulator
MSSLSILASPRRASRTRSGLDVVVVEPLHVIRAALALFISKQPDMEVILEAGTADRAMDGLRRVATRSRVIVLISVAVHGERDAFWLMRAIRDTFPTFIVLGMGPEVDEMTISRSLFAGADGFVDKSARPDAFVDALRRSAREEIVLAGLPPARLGAIAQGIDRQRTLEPPLTPRERQVIQAAADGLTARQIGRRIGMSERTVTTHLSRIYRKFGVSNRVAALAAAGRSQALRLRVAE